MKLSILIPVYHEEKNIEKTLSKIEKNVTSSHEILILFDNKDDPTLVISRQYIKIHTKKNIRLIIESQHRKVKVMDKIKTGIKKSKGKALVVLMADLSDDISQIDEMYGFFLHGFDIVCGSRYMKGGKKIGGPLLKTFLSMTAGLTLFYFFQIPTHDSTNAFKLYSKKIFKKIKIESTGGFEYSLEIVLKAYKAGYKITEIPTVWRDRVSGASNFKILHWIPQYLKWYMRAFNVFL